MTAQSDITAADDWHQGEDTDIEWVIYTDAKFTTKQDITGYTIEFRMGVTENAPSIYTKQLAITDGPNGKCKLVSGSSETAGFNPFKYLYNLSRTDSGANAVLASGKAVLKARIQ
jgi:hypothetical protein